MLEVGLPHPLLKEGVQVVMTPTVPHNRALNTSTEFLRALLPEVLPIIVYAISRDDLSDAVSVRFPYALLLGVAVREAVLCVRVGVCCGEVDVCVGSVSNFVRSYWNPLIIFKFLRPNFIYSSVFLSLSVCLSIYHLSLYPVSIFILIYQSIYIYLSWPHKRTKMWACAT